MDWYIQLAAKEIFMQPDERERWYRVGLLYSAGNKSYFHGVSGKGTITSHWIADIKLAARMIFMESPERERWHHIGLLHPIGSKEDIYRIF